MSRGEIWVDGEDFIEANHVEYLLQSLVETAQDETAVLIAGFAPGADEAAQAAAVDVVGVG